MRGVERDSRGRELLIKRACVVSGVLKDFQDGTLRLIHDTS